jgi:hypothetical protein
MSGDDPHRTAIKLINEQASANLRRVWHDGRWLWSVIDVVGLLTDSQAPRQYWGTLKARMADESAHQTLANCLQLKMPAADGKQRLTDAGDAETILRIVESVPSPKAEPFKVWLAGVGGERLQEMGDPSLAADRMRRDDERMGYSTEWIRAP